MQNIKFRQAARTYNNSLNRQMTFWDKSELNLTLGDDGLGLTLNF